MHFVLMITGPAYGTQMASSAYQFTQALLTKNHKVISIFFYREGVYNANSLTSPATDEIDLVRCWYNLYKQYGVLLHICISAALRRGITNITEVEECAELSKANIQDGFLLSSLNTLTEAILICDRLVQF